MRRSVLLLPLAICFALTACSKPEVPEHDDPPKPQSAPAATAEATELRDAIQQPIDKANAAQDATAEAAQRQDDAIEAATGQ